ncbi:Fe-S cluster assembly protein SufD [Protaetiibacter sp. 10F1B-8-1]|uniref:Fe-S cluster assembly protein SufD n=1 Tax=Protaetiibacter mangrovi TaxID=2970926 RepID=A0ABT1ZC25_9MICO|nr:Fe-S cluster assembly protein SufD [Protaetiibacter mangrovi]MCS0498263.1 Fe-S cluster assembly protein SufD [Protaetiibacter mangrovi]
MPVQTRSERFASTSHDDFPEVTGREAIWKYAPVDKLRELIDGELDGSPYAILYPEAAGTDVEWIDRTHELVGSAGTPEDRAAANAWTSFEKALHIRLDGEAETLTVTRTALGTTARAAHTVISAAKGSTGLVVLDSQGVAKLTENLEIVLEDDANITVVSVQEWDDTALHLASQFARIGHGATLTHIVVSLGGEVVRVNPSAHLAGEGADAELYGVYFADAGQHLEQQVYVHHEAAHTRSRVTYKGALNGEGAHTVWIGDVLIGRDATGTDTYEQNRNLVLSDGTRADSIPNLEIETGDIEGAGHASATGRFDDEQLFYLQARGIPEDEARRLVVLGFLSEIVQKIGEPALEARLHEALEAELAGTR